MTKRTTTKRLRCKKDRKYNFYKDSVGSGFSDKTTFTGKHKNTFMPAQCLED